MDKLKSRKFWVAVAAFLGSIATTIGGLTIDNEAITITGIICSAASAAIYAACEAYTDGARAKANSVTTSVLETKQLSETKAVNVNSNASALAEKVLVPTPVETTDTAVGGTE